MTATQICMVVASPGVWWNQIRKIQLNIWGCTLLLRGGALLIGFSSTMERACTRESLKKETGVANAATCMKWKAYSAAFWSLSSFTVLCSSLQHFLIPTLL